MNNKKAAFFIVLSILGLLLLLFCLFLFLSTIDDANGLQYPNGGRDTYEQFGNRRFVILSGNGTLTLYDRSIAENQQNYRYKEDNNTVERDVYGYIENENFVYTIGSYGYTKLNFNSGEYIQFSDLEPFSTEDRNIFNSMILLKK